MLRDSPPNHGGPMTAGTTAPPSAARERILETATRLFYAHGLRAVGVDTIIAESGVAKATFYKHFPAKDDLIAAYLDVVDEMWTGQLHRAAEAAGAAPADQLVGVFDALGSACRREGYRGCGFINGARRTTRGTVDHAGTAAHKRRVLAWLRALSEDAGAQPPERLARSLALLLDGALSNGALDADPEAVEVARETAA